MVANQEPKYAQAVFERLRETLNVVLTDSAIIACHDDSIQLNYDIREDGLWLRDCCVDFLNWTPVCDLKEVPGSPDPLTTPALPFPFTARQLAAFTFDGWGMLLAERFTGNDGEIDTEIVKALLNGVRDAKPREAITAAFAALAEARKDVVAPDRKLNTAERKAKTAYDKKYAEAERLHNWQEAGITEAERRARVQRRNEAVAAKKSAYQRAKAANENTRAEWRRAVVRRLLEDAPNDPKGTAQLADYPAASNTYESQGHVLPDMTGWALWKSTILTHWSSIQRYYARVPTAREAINWAAQRGPANIFVRNQTIANTFKWINLEGDEQETTVKSAQNTVSEWKRARLLPPYS